MGTQTLEPSATEGRGSAGVCVPLCDSQACVPALCVSTCSVVAAAERRARSSCRRSAASAASAAFAVAAAAAAALARLSALSVTCGHIVTRGVADNDEVSNGGGAAARRG
jgi:hypothetical protein